MGDKKSVAKQPMLYITQPSLQKAEANMQSSYQSKKEERKASAKEKEEGAGKEEKKPRLRTTRRLNLKNELRTESPILKEPETKQEELSKVSDAETETENETQSTLDDGNQSDSDEYQDDSQHARRKRRNKFRDMSLEERVQYFIQLPPQVPKMKCEVSTEEESYRGWIDKYEEGTVTMKIIRRPFHINIPFESIREIRLMGF